MGTLGLTGLALLLGLLAATVFKPRSMLLHVAIVVIAGGVMVDGTANLIVQSGVAVLGVYGIIRCFFCTEA